VDKTKPKQEMKNSNYIALLAVVTILVLLVGGLLAKNFFASFLLNQKVLTKKNAAQVILASDVNAARNITVQYKGLGSQAQTVADSLPSDPDIPGLANAIESMAATAGVQFTSVGDGVTASPTAPAAAAGTPGAVTATTSTAATAVPITISITTSYNNLNHFLSLLESSSRPIVVSSIQLTGLNSKLIVSITATTYYQNPVSFNITKVGVQ
jgi:Tfp pilus assembly protein PilO